MQRVDMTVPAGVARATLAANTESVGRCAIEKWLDETIPGLSSNLASPYYDEADVICWRGKLPHVFQD